MTTALSIMRSRQVFTERPRVPPETTALGKRLVAWADANPEAVAYGHADIAVAALRKALEMGDIYLSPFIFEIWAACPECIKETQYVA